MQASSFLLFFGVLIPVLNACIEPFTPDIGAAGDYLVINGTITDEEGYHYVDISRTTSYSDREYLPVNDCEVIIFDGHGNQFSMENYADGKYRAWIEKQYLQTGNRFKKEVISNNGKKYQSDFDTLVPCPEIDNIYFEYQEIIPDDPEEPTGAGIQFYIDFDATGDFASNYRWEAIETWEYNAEHLIKAIYYGIDSSYGNYRLDIKVLNPGNLDDWKQMYSLYTCWKTSRAKGIFTYTTQQKRDKKVVGLPLYLVTNKENRLTIKYSILLEQITLSDAAFTYWNQLQIQSQETGGLYETQPYKLEGNIRCIDDENETVIGFFSASSVKTKRYTTTIHINPNYYYCGYIVEEWEFLLRYLWGGEPGQPPPPDVQLPHTPLYLQPVVDEHGITYALLDQSCFDCRLKGGTLTKPDYR